MKYLSLLLAIGVLTGTACTESLPPRPNIILINVDDIGYGDFGVYGQREIKTPRIDRMAAEGARFTHFYASAPVCGPSRASLLTGMHSGHLQSCGNGQANLTENFTLWPQLIRDNGYTTAMFGKQHKAQLAGDTVLGDGPIERGFNTFLGWLNAVDAHQYFIDGKTVGWARRQYLFAGNAQDGYRRHEIAPTRYTHKEFLDQATAFLKESHPEPFLLYLPFTIAHAELAVPKMGEPDFGPEDEGLLEQYLDKEGKSIFPEFDYQGDTIYARPNPFLTRATLAGMISRLDRDIGNILDLLVAQGMAENTLVILTSDNGPHDEGGVDPRQIDGILKSPFESNGALRGFKRSLHEGGIRVPALAWWPGTVAEGTVIEEPLANFDIGPTLLELSGSPEIEGADGRSFASLLRGKATNASVHPHLYFQFGTQQTICKGKWKAYRGQNQSPQDPVELYDLTVDPGEIKDLAQDPAHADLLRELRGLLNQENEGSACSFVPLAN